MSAKNFPTQPMENETESEILKSSECSCTNCDSMYCFMKRNQPTNELCSCSKCNHPKTCLFYSNKMIYSDEIKSDGIKVNTKKPLIETKITEKRIKKEVMYDDKTNTKTTTQKQSKYSYKSSPGIKTFDIKSKTKIGNEQLTQVHSVAISFSKRELSSNTEELSAQIMNVPYKDLKDSMSSKSEGNSRKDIKIIEQDIFKRIKEAYKACSCKICECITSNFHINNNNSCKCEPCNCHECTRLTKELQRKEGENWIPDVNCPCIRCDRSDCKGIKKAHEHEICDCKPCECIECSDSIAKTCDCEPCQCIECKSMAIYKPRTMVVAPVGEEIQRNVCQCSPCDCIECGQVFRGVPLNRTHEMSIGTNRNNNCHCDSCFNDACIDSESCRCETRDEIIRKPVERDRNYNIRRVVIKDKDTKADKVGNHDTITMFAALSNNYLKAFSNTRVCTNKDYHLLRKHRKQDLSISNNSQFMLNDGNLKTISTGSKCNPCECQMCTRLKENNVLIGQENNYKSDFSNCAHCEQRTKFNEVNINTKSLNRFHSSNICTSIPCQCIDCQKIMSNCIGDVCHCADCKCERCSEKNTISDETLYPIKRGQPLTPSMFAINANSNCYKTLTKHEHFKTLKKFHNSASEYQVFSWNNDLVESIKQRPVANNTSLRCEKDGYDLINAKTRKLNDIVKCKNTDESKSHDSQMSRHYASDCSTYRTASKTSHCINSLNVSPSLSSRKEFRNIIGYDYRYYSKRSPKNNCRTLSTDNDLNLDREINSEHMNNLLLTEKNSEDIYSKKIRTPYNRIRSSHVIKNENNICESIPREYDIYLEMSKKITDERICNPRDYNQRFYKAKSHRCRCSCNCINIRNPDTTNVLHIQNEDIGIFSKCSRENISLKECIGHYNHSLDQNSYLNLSLLNDKVVEVAQGAIEFKKYITKDHCLNTLRNESLEHANPSPDLYNKNQIHFNTSNENYEKLLKTLREAKSFSLELIKILETYEKANREFQSVSQKLIMCDEPDLSFNSTIDNKNIKTNKGDYNTENNEKNNINNTEFSFSGYNINENIECQENNPQDILPEKDVTDYVLLNDGKSGLKPIISNKCIDSEREDAMSNNNENVKDDNTLVAEHIRISYKDTNKTQIVKPFRKIPLVTNIKSQVNTRKSIKFHRLMKHTIITMSRRTNSKNMRLKFINGTKNSCLAREMLIIAPDDKQTLSNNSFKKALEKNQVKRNQFTIIKEIDTTLTNFDILRHPTSTLGSIIPGVNNNNGIEVTIKIPKMRELEFDQNTITMTNSIINDRRCTENKGISVFPILESEQNEIIKSKSLQTNKEFYFNTRRSFYGKNNSTCKSSCEDLKVRFINLTKVSDHTLLVKWNVPKNLNDVQGYELLVDGRAVQKNLSPTRTMAVVTCVTRKDHVLLTIRTLVSSASNFDGHSPSTTIAYRSRII